MLQVCWTRAGGRADDRSFISDVALLEVKNLSVTFPAPDGAIRAVEDVSFAVEEGTTVGLVGESGSGKTTIGRALLKLRLPPPTLSGEVRFDGPGNPRDAANGSSARCAGECR